MVVKTTTTYYNLEKFQRGGPVVDADIASNMDLIDAALHDIDMGSSTIETSADPATNAAVSTAIIDANSGVIITLTGSGNAQTLQSPTTTAAGRKFTVVTDDANAAYTIEVNGITMSAGEAQRFIWDGSAWVAVTAVDADDIAFTPAGGISATEVQAAIEEVDAETLRRVSSTTVALDVTGQTTLYTVPAGKIFIPVMAVLRADASANTSAVTLGRVGALTDFLDTITLSNVTAAGDMCIMMPVPNATPVTLKTYAAAVVFQIDVTTGNGGATNYVDLFGYVIDA